MNDPFLTLRATIEANCAAPSVVLISSAMPRDGKTAVSAGLAEAFAQSGCRTLAIDFGAKPALAKAIGTKDLPVIESPRGTDTLAVRHIGEHLDAARIAATAMGKSALTDLERFFAALRARYDFTVIDGCELTAGAVALARIADGVILTVRRGRPTAEADREAVLLLERFRANFIGVVSTGRGELSPRRRTLAAVPESRTPEMARPKRVAAVSDT